MRGGRLLPWLLVLTLGGAGVAFVFGQKGGEPREAVLASAAPTRDARGALPEGGVHLRGHEPAPGDEARALLEQPAPHRPTLAHAGGPLAIRTCVDGDPERPVPDVALRLLSAGVQVAEGRTDAKGEWRVTSAPAEPLELRVEKPGWIAAPPSPQWDFLVDDVELDAAPEANEPWLVPMLVVGALRGRVVSAATGTPLSDARVEVCDLGDDPWFGFNLRHARTRDLVMNKTPGLVFARAACDAEGTFALEGVPCTPPPLPENPQMSFGGKRTLALAVRAPGCATRWFEVVENACGAPPRTYALPAAGVLNGSVLTADGEAVAGARVLLWHGGTRPRATTDLTSYVDWFAPVEVGAAPRSLYAVRSAVTDAAGRFACDDLTLGEVYELAAVARGWAPTAVPAPVGPGSATSPREVELRLAPSASLLVEVQDAEGQPVAGEWVGLSGPNPWELTSAPDVERRTDAQGRLRVSDLPEGEYSVRATGIDSQTITLARGATRSVALRRPPPATPEVEPPTRTLRGQVVSDAGKPLEGAGIRVASRYVETNAQGAFEVAVPLGPPLFVDVVPPHGYRERDGLPAPEGAAPMHVVLQRRPHVRMLLALPTPATEHTLYEVEQCGPAGRVRTTGELRWTEDPSRRVEELPLDDAATRLNVCVFGYRVVTRAVTVPASGTVDLGRLSFEPGLDLWVRVLDDRGEPLEDVRVSARQAERDQYADTDSAGRVHLAGWEHAPLFVAASKNKHGSDERRVNLGASGATITLNLAREGTLLVRVRTAAGHPCPRVPIEAGEEREQGACSFGSEVLSDDEGLARISAVPGAWRARVVPPARPGDLTPSDPLEGASAPVLVRPAETSLVELILPGR